MYVYLLPLVASKILTLQRQILRAILVDPLPVGARLITVFDTCHSASLLGEFVALLNETVVTYRTLSDLKHTRCNRVWVPWINKGRRRSNTQWNRIGGSPTHFLPLSNLNSGRKQCENMPKSPSPQYQRHRRQCLQAPNLRLPRGACFPGHEGPSDHKGSNHLYPERPSQSHNQEAGVLNAWREWMKATGSSRSNEKRLVSPSGQSSTIY